MTYEVDSSGYPQDPELRQLEFRLGDLAALWRGSYSDVERQTQIIQEYHAILSQLYKRGWDAELDLESELPDALMPNEYVQRNAPRPINPFHKSPKQTPM